MKTWACRHACVVRNKFFRLIKIHYLKALAFFKSVLYPGFVLTSFLWLNKIRLKFLQHANKTLNAFTTRIRTFGSRALVLCIFRAYFSTVVVFVVWTLTYSSHFCGWKGPALLRAFDTVEQKYLDLNFLVIDWTNCL